MNAGTHPGTAQTPEARRQEAAELFRLARDGDNAAMEQLVRRLMPLVWNVARAQGISREAALDVVQTVWLSLLDNLTRIRRYEAVAGWLVIVARREAWRVGMAERRSVPTDPTAVVLDEPDRTEDVAALVSDEEQHRCLWRNLDKLPPRCQELLRTIAFSDRPNYGAISEALGMPKGSIGPTRGRCLAQLRKLLGNDPGWSSR